MADTKVVSATDVYKTKPGKAVSLKVVIGSAQVGATTLRLNGTVVPFADQQKPVDLGVVAVPSILDCITLVQDENVDTNLTEVTYTLSGGPKSQDYRFALEASAQGRVRYEITFILA